MKPPIFLCPAISRLHCAIAASLVFATTAFARDYKVTLAAPAADAVGQVVTFELPADAPQPAALLNSKGQPVPLQTNTDRSAQFVVSQQKSGEALTYTLTSTTSAAAPADASRGVAVVSDHGDLRIAVGGQPALFYRVDRDAVPRADIKPEILRAGYIHPVLSPAGHVVTDDYPSNHVHHHGVWAPWTKTQFQGRSPDFWNMQKKSGAEELVAVDRTWSGVVHGGLEARLRSMDLTVTPPVAALDTKWELTAYDVAGTARPIRMFDLRITHKCATADALQLPQYIYGGFAVRGAAAWNGPGDAARFLTSEGITDRIQGNNTRARWVYLGGAIASAGELAGTTVLGHPENFRAPQPVRLHPDMPYFSFAPQQLGPFSIEPGTPYVAKFRFIVTDGTPDAALFDACWQAYASPVTATLTPL